MATNLVGYINLAASNLDTFTNAAENDLMIYTSNSTQKVLIGVQSNVAASITVSSNLISFNNNISFGSAITMKGLQIGMSDGTMANISTNSVQGLSNESTGNIQFSVNSNSLSNNFRFQASNVEVARITGTGSFGIGTSNISAAVHAYGPNPISSNIPVNMSNLLGWYQFEGNGLDSSSNSYNLTLTGSNVVYIPGQYGDAVWFNNPANSNPIGGSVFGNTYFLQNTIGSNVGITPPISIAFWFNLGMPVSSSAYQPYMVIYGGSNRDAGITFNVNVGSQLIVGIRTANTALSYSVTGANNVNLTPGTWYHAAATYDGSTFQAYFNGATVGSALSATGNLLPLGLRVGDSVTPTGNPGGFIGALDDLRIYNRLLTLNDIVTLYNSTASNLPAYLSAPPPTGLVGWYPFEADGNDNSGNRYHAIVTGTPLYVSGKVGNAVFFPNNAGSTQIHSLDVYGYAGLSYQAPVSIAFWVNMSTFGAENGLVNIGSPASDQGIYVAYYNNANDKLTFWIHNGSWNTIAGNVAQLTTRTWYHIAISYTSGFSQIYLNGQLLRTVTNITGNPTNVSALRIGGRISQNVSLCGCIDDVRVYNRIVTPGEIFDLYNQTNIGAGNGNSVITTGAVGIGRVPQYPLDVSGTIRASQDIVTTGNLSAGNIGMFRNRIINGDCAIDQRFLGTSVALAASSGQVVYFADRWFAWTNRYTTFGITAQRVTDAPISTYLDFSIKYTATNTLSGGTNPYLLCGQNIEGYNMYDLRFGTGSNALPATLSFWVKSGRAGQYTCTLENNTETRQLLLPYNVYSSGVWEYKTLQIPPCADGTWEKTSNVGLRMFLLSQSGYSATTDSLWRTVTTNWAYNFAGTINPLQVNGDYIQFTGVQFEKGTLATPFEYRPYAIELQLCQRYFIKLDLQNLGVTVNAADGYNSSYTLRKLMRATPTLDANVPTSYEVNTGSVGTVGLRNSAGLRTNVDSVWFYNVANNWTTSAVVAVTCGLSAEL